MHPQTRAKIVRQGYPILRCRVEVCENGQILLRAYCPYCAREHTHGGGNVTSPINGKDGFGHRGAHCPTGPFRDGGYYLEAEPPR
ncbi:MAG: hypothetical protein ACYC0H_23500 [Solirubrobacteraceae bacterium]